MAMSEHAQPVTPRNTIRQRIRARIAGRKMTGKSFVMKERENATPASQGRAVVSLWRITEMERTRKKTATASTCPEPAVSMTGSGFQA